LKDEDWSSVERRENGWDDSSRQEAIAICGRILDRPYWGRRAREGLNSKDEQVFYDANTVAGYLGIDTWDVHWRRLQEKPLDSGRWFHAMHGASPQRARKVIACAVEVLPLAEVATGPAEEMGLGKEYEVHGCLDFVVQDLGRYPGEGRPLVAAALGSPVVRNRNMALKALSEWGQDKWPAEAASALRAAEAAEPDEDVKKEMRKVIAGEALVPPRAEVDE
jgi:hypothetical protein